MRSLMRVGKQCTCPFCGVICTDKFYCKHLNSVFKRRQHERYGYPGNDKILRTYYINEFVFDGKK